MASVTRDEEPSEDARISCWEDESVNPSSLSLTTCEGSFKVTELVRSDRLFSVASPWKTGDDMLEVLSAWTRISPWSFEPSKSKGLMFPKVFDWDETVLSRPSSWIVERRGS